MPQVPRTHRTRESHMAQTRPSHNKDSYEHNLKRHRASYEQMDVDGLVEPWSIPESYIQTHMLDPLAAIQNLINGPATVTIDDSGLTIEDGALTLKDEFGETVLVASGFAGSWADFLNGGLYNYTFTAGIAGDIPDGRSASLPYWTVSRSGSSTLTWTAQESISARVSTGESLTILSDAVRVKPNTMYEVQVNGEVVGVGGVGSSGTADIEVAVLKYRSDGVLDVTTVLGTVRHTGATGGGGDDVYFDRFQYETSTSHFFVQVRVKSTFVSASGTEANSQFRHISHLIAPQADWYGVAASSQAVTSLTNNVQTVLAGAFTVLGADPYDFITAGATSQITIPESGAGIYRIMGTISIAAGVGAGTLRRLNIRVNGADARSWTWGPNANVAYGIPFTWMGSLADGDVVDFSARQDTGGAVNGQILDLLVERVGPLLV